MDFMWYVRRLIPDGFWTKEFPPWYSETFSGPWPGKHDHWTELGYTDPILAQGKIRGLYPVMREDDPLWWDPPVKDGESMFGVAGKDNIYPGGQYLKWDNPMPKDEYVKYMYENNPTIKNIYSKWDISKEHPGMRYSWNLTESNFHTDPRDAGQVIPVHVDWFRWPWLEGWSHTKWPQFFSAPMGEDCFTKTAAVAKWSALGSGLWWMMKYTSKDRNPAPFMRHIKGYGKIAWLPMGMGMLWASTSCLACSARKTDDYRNLLVGSLAAASLYGHTRGSFLGGYGMFVYLAIGSIFWHGVRISEAGFGGHNRAKQLAHAPILWQKSNLAHPPPTSELRQPEWTEWR